MSVTTAPLGLEIELDTLIPTWPRATLFLTVGSDRVACLMSESINPNYDGATLMEAAVGIVSDRLRERLLER